MYRIVVPIGAVVHAIVLFAVFDIYFISPIHHGMPQHHSHGSTYAKRVVLFVSDGLRAESLYTNMNERAPFLHSILKNATHGISHCQVPTESRPGHASILGGVYEDPSAIGRGWTHNPVDYDTVLNASMNSWCWGSPDIIDMFNKDGLPHIHLYTYGAHEQDFSGKENPSNLDNWVFENVNNFFAKSRTNANLHKVGNVFFLHLLGLDTAGHTLKPTSKAFLSNIKVVDRGVENITKLVNNFFNDDKTAYIFTSDHGMTDWGSHGSGSKYETEVPIIVWGAGVNQNRINNLKQVDIATLISSLLNIHIPVNSEGVVPLNFLNMSEHDKVLHLETNAKQMSEKFLKLHNTALKNTLFFLYQPYQVLNQVKLSEMFRLSEKYIDLHLYHDAVSKAGVCAVPTIVLNEEIIKLCLDGISYYNGYYRNLILIFITIGFVGWMIFLIINIMQTNDIPMNSSRILNLTSEIIVILLWLLIYVQSLPIMYYFYSGFPVITWWAVLGNRQKLDLFKEIKYEYRILLFVLLVLVAILLITFTFFHPIYLTVLLILSCWFTQRRNNYKYINFMICMHLLALFPMIRLPSEFNAYLLILSIIVWGLIFFQIYTKPLLLHKKLKQPRLVTNVIIYQFVLLLIAAFNILMVEWTMSKNQGLLIFNQIISWFLLIASIILPCFSGVQLIRRLFSITLGLTTVYTLMSSHLETLFMVVFSYTLLQWTVTDMDSVNEKRKQIIDNFNRTLLFMAFIMLAFFGTGNIADINFFNPMWTRCFVSVFSPFTISGLIFLKLASPFMATICSLRIIITNSGTNSKQVFMQILFFCDCMLLQFLFMVKNQGSWLEIGLSLSRFIIADVMIIVIILFYGISRYVVTSDLRNFYKCRFF